MVYLALICTLARHLDAAPVEPVFIDERSASASESLPVIQMHVVGSSAARQGLQRLLGAEHRGKARMTWGSLSGFDRQQIFARLPARGARIHCWIDLTDPGLAHLYFVVPTVDRFMMRDLAIEQLGSFEFESLAQIIELSLDALLTDEQAGISRQQAQSILKPPMNELRRPTAKRDHPVTNSGLNPVRFAVAGHYAITRYSAALALQHGPGISFAVERLSTSVLRTVALSSSLYLPRRIRNETAAVSVGYASLALELAQLWALGADRQHRLGPTLGVGIAVVQATPFAGDLPGSYELLPRTRTLEYRLGSGLSWRFEFSERLSLQTELKFNFVPKPLRHEFIVDGQAQAITEGLFFRPTLGVSVFVH